MNKKIIFFVILHYQAFEQTISCVESIKKLKCENVQNKIVIVDNASPNGSGKGIERKYKNDSQVKVILNLKNVGFAKGNNLGFIYAHDNGADFIVLINNDTLITSLDFSEKINELYKKNNFGVLGPNIKSVYDGVHQNPMKGFNITHKNVCKQLIKAYLMLFANKLNLTSFTIKIRKKNKIYNNEYTKEYQISKKFDYILHGSCLIFSKEYMRIFPKGLNSNTYMYYEEHILAYQCYCNGIKMIYSPELEIEHYRNVSTNMLSNKNKKKERINFFYRQSINSLKVLKKLVKEGNNEIKET